MTEEEWLACEDLDSMLACICDHPSDRKLRPFACACIRQGWEVLEGESGRAAVEAAEAFADGEQTKADLRRVRREVASHMDAVHSRFGGTWGRDPMRHAEFCMCEAARRAASERNLGLVLNLVSGRQGGYYPSFFLYGDSGHGCDSQKPSGEAGQRVGYSGHHT